MFLDYQLNYLIWLQNFRELTHDVMTPFMLSVTHLGEFVFPLMFLALVYWSLNKKAGEFLLINLLFAMEFNQFTKMLCCIQRPWVLSDKIKPVKDAIQGASGYSFPSGHTACATAIWGGLMVWLWKNKIIRYSLLILILLIAFSRNYLGVHTLQDVLFSLFIGILILFISNKFFKNIDKNKNEDTKIFITGILFLIFSVITANIKASINTSPEFLANADKHMTSFYIISGYISGGFIGWFLCRKFIPFSTDDISWRKRLIRYVLGLSLLSLIIFNTHQTLTNDFGEIWGGFFYTFIINIFITFFYPWIFTRLEKYTNRKWRNYEKLD